MLWFGHKKRLENVEKAVVNLDSDVRKGFESVGKQIQEIADGFEDVPDGTGQNEAAPVSTMAQLMDRKLSKLDEELLNCTDPVRVTQLIQLKNMIRKNRNQEESRERMRLWRMQHPNAGKQRADDDYEEAELLPPPNEQDVDRIAQRVGVNKEGQLDPANLHASLQNILKNPMTAGAARKIAKSMFGIDDLDGAVGVLGQVVQNPELSTKLATEVGTGLAGFVKDKLTPFIMPKPGSNTGIVPTSGGNGQQQSMTANQVPQPYKVVNGVPVAMDGFRLFVTPAGVVDPRQAYIVPA